MRNSIFIFSTGFFLAAFVVVMVSIPAAAQPGVGPSDAAVREAFQSILSSADADKDGKLSIQECLAIWKDRMTAEKNCRYWDADGDGTITEEEYVKHSRKLMR